MNRMKKHRIKEEKATTSRTTEEHDLAYFIHDRVELMHQVFSVLKSKELKALAPDCVRRLSIDDLQELCLEELLGISSKRLCAILDGAEPPSDTDSSSQSAEQLETISLDSISSDEEILSQSSKKKKHKHRHSKKKRRKKSKGSDEEQGESRASRAGLTVLELLELQARARAIRAQLHQEPARSAGVQEPVAEASSDNDEVLIKEEPADVVEISSDEEKPDVARLQKEIEASTTQSNETANNKDGNSQSVTKRINDLIITVPQSKPTRKIKLKRQKPTDVVTRQKTPEKVKENVIETSNTSNSTSTSSVINSVEREPIKANTDETKNKIKKSKKKKKKTKEKQGSDEDEITIQLSDTEKMDLLEDLDAKNLDTVTSSDSDSSDNSEHQSDNGKVADEEKVVISENNALGNSENKMDNSEDKNTQNNTESIKMDIVVTVNQNKEDVQKDDEIRGYVSNYNSGTIEINDLPVITDEITISKNKDESTDTKVDNKQNNDKCNVSDQPVGSGEEKTNESSSYEKGNDCKTESSSCHETKSDGEISDRESSGVEASDVQPVVVCISDDEGKSKKKKKKEKKKSKKEKKKSDFSEGHDENFYKDKEIEGNSSSVIETINDDDNDDDDVYEYLEISDDSSCYEVEGVSVLSKEPTAEEIVAFSAKMDEIDIDRVEKVILSEDSRTELNETSDIENVSWKDRYLGSKKVKRVLTTSNILNAIRKKNRELKKKLEEAKMAEKDKETEVEKDASGPALEDGTIEQYETLQGSTKFVDPVKEPEAANISKEEEENKEAKENASENVTKEMKKDAKMLLKMYKRLLKYNDITKQKDRNKKKKKKYKKNKDKGKEKVAVNV